MDNLCHFVGGPFNGCIITVGPTIRELLTPQDGLMLRYIRLEEQFWLDEWSRPLTADESAEVEMHRDGDWNAWDRWGANLGNPLLSVRR